MCPARNFNTFLHRNDRSYCNNCSQRHSVFTIYDNASSDKDLQCWGPSSPDDSLPPISDSDNTVPEVIQGRNEARNAEYFPYTSRENTVRKYKCVVRKEKERLTCDMRLRRTRNALSFSDGKIKNSNSARNPSSSRSVLPSFFVQRLLSMESF